MDATIRILYVDDARLDRELVRDSLQKHGDVFHIVEAASRQEFESRLAEGRFDLVLSDFNILGFDGLQVIDVIKEKARGVPVVIVTGTGSEEVAVEAMKRGAADYVIKTVQYIQRLPQTIRNTLERQRLHEAQQRLIAILEATPDFVGSASARDKQILYINRAGRQMIGIGQEEDLAGLNLSDLHPGWANRLLTDVAFPAATRYGAWKGECAFLSRDGREIPVSAVLMTHRSSSGETEAFSLVSRDITERKRTEAELIRAKDAAEAASHAKSEFLGNMSHELRTPLNAIIGFSEGLLQRVDIHPLNEHQKDRIDRIRHRGEDLLGLITGILDLAKVESGKMDVNATTFDVKPLAEEVCEAGEALCSHKMDVRVVLDVECGLPPITSDRDKIRQILLNLVGNAVKFTDRGLVTLRARRSDQYVMLGVEDTGIGIPEGQLQRVFEEFYELNQATRLAPKGTGLGLAICKAYAQLLGASLTARSTVGEGSTFTLAVPLTLPKNGVAQEQEEEAAARS